MANHFLLNKMVDDSSNQQINLIIHYGTYGKSEFLYLQGGHTYVVGIYIVA